MIPADESAFAALVDMIVVGRRAVIEQVTKLDHAAAVAFADRLEPREVITRRARAAGAREALDAFDVAILRSCRG